jgi:hypothetical protein
MRSYWDLAALDLSLGKVDLLPLAPDPIDGLAFTPDWAEPAEIGTASGTENRSP